MNDFIWFLAVGLVTMSCLLLILRFLLRYTSKSRRINLRDASLSISEFEEYAQKSATRHHVSQKRDSFTWPLPDVNRNYAFILSVYKSLNDDARKKLPVPAAAEWLLDNFYIISKQVQELRLDLNKRSYLRLPVLKENLRTGRARIYAVVADLLTLTNGQMDETALTNYLKAYQKENTLFEREIAAIPLVAKFALIENLRFVCESIQETRIHWQKADESFRKISADFAKDSGCTAKKLKEHIAEADYAPSYIEHLHYRLRRSKLGFADVIWKLDSILKTQGTSVERITRKEHNAQSLITVSMSNTITSLRYFAVMDWEELLRSSSELEKVLCNDPDGSYPKMDKATRSRYRSKAETLAAEYRCSELHVANEALRLAENAQKESGPEASCTGSDNHVGCYLIGKGVSQLEACISGSHRRRLKSLMSSLNSRKILYFTTIGGIILAVLFVTVKYCISVGGAGLPIALLAAMAVLIPASEIAVQIVNRIVCSSIKPDLLPKMELKEGITDDLGTIVVIPTLLPHAARVQELLETMESHYLSNRDNNLYFALLGAFKDSDQAHIDGDDSVIEAALSGIKQLNQKYSAGEKDKFYFYHRSRQYNESNNIWIGWERKRGALLEFGRMLMGLSNTSFAYMSSVTPPVVKYVITLDCDTILPIGTARALVGTMAHPLNRPVVDYVNGTVKEGYGILQPRIDVDVECAGKTIFSRIFTTPDGIDPYSGAISDVYQDMFGEGIFTGKGIYDLQVYQHILTNTFPENTVLSHDLLEGSYLRAGLVTDIRLVDTFPVRFNAHSSRQLRWIRGDWQLLPHLMSRVRTGNPGKISNPLSALSKWKITDNLRRSMVAPALMFLMFLALTVLPGGVAFWVGVLLSVAFLPFLFILSTALLAAIPLKRKTKRYVIILSELKSSLVQCSLYMVFLPYQAWQSISGIFVTLIRLFTGKNLLTWVTSADVEVSQRNSPGSYLRMMSSVFFLVAATLIATLWRNPETTLFFSPLLFIWIVSPLLAYGISRSENNALVEIPESEQIELGRIARKTWRYFEEFASKKNHYLAPDNYQLDPPKGVAPRTSPTNIGFGLLATLTARDMGYIGMLEMTELLDKTITTIESLKKWNGHLYNWYDTRTLIPLNPEYISTVDSGNLSGYLITLEQGLRQYLKRPFDEGEFHKGVRDTMNSAGEDGAAVWLSVLAEPNFLKQLSSGKWIERIKNEVWKTKLQHMIMLHNQERMDFLPAVRLLDNSTAALFVNVGQTNASDIEYLLELLRQNLPLCEMPAVYSAAATCANHILVEMREAGDCDNNDCFEWLSECEAVLTETKNRAEQFINQYNSLIQRVENLWKDMTFLPLYDEKKKLFSIGYNMREEKLTASYYDLLASEARQASYIAIATGEVHVSHWFSMGRALTVVDRYKGLASWTGTMFEYLMPLLIMKSYRNTLLDESYHFAVRCQKKYGKLRNMPWGTSESGFYSLDTSHDYQYKAIGVPWLGLKGGLAEDAVIAPYATFLALSIDPSGAVENIHRLKTEGLEGPYGFFEAADYTPERLVFESKRAIVKSYMAHHQGMSLVALNNYLHDGIMQERFHSNPSINTARLLLQEKTPANILLAKTLQEKIEPVRKEIRHVDVLMPEDHIHDPALPRTHILTNGNYSVMLTEQGTGYSKSRMAAVTRWREDRTLDTYGTFIYLRNASTGDVWSSALAPINKQPENYNVLFEPDKAVFTRSDGFIETKTEVTVASGDNTEIRRITLKNCGTTSCLIEVTSYFEVVIAPLSDDIAHPAFSNLFVETAFDAERSCITASRRPRSDNEKRNWLAHTVITDDGSYEGIQFETDRMQFLGRGHTVQSPDGLYRGKPLSGNVGAVLDPSVSLRVRVSVKPGKSTCVSFVTLIGGSREHIISQIDKYRSNDGVQQTFRIALQRGRIETHFRDLSADKIRLYQVIISHILFISPSKQRHAEVILQNKLGQSSLWKYGISGDMPVVLLHLNEENQISLLYEVILAHEYWRLMDVRADLVIICDEEYSYNNPLYKLIADIVASQKNTAIFHSPRDSFVIEKNLMSPDELALFYSVARVIFKGNNGTMQSQINAMDTAVLPKRRIRIKNDDYDFTAVQRETELAFNNDLGGFSPDGKEYIIQPGEFQNTPAPWVNVIANPHFGFVASESGSGYTWYENSHEYRLTPWTNDAVSDSPGEIFYLTDTETCISWTPTMLPVREGGAYKVHHGFGYTVYEHTSHAIEQTLTQHVPVDDSLKVSTLRVKNLSLAPRKLSVTYYVRPVLGVSDQTTAPHIHTSTTEKVNLLAKNPYNETFPDRVCFIHTSGQEVTFTGNRLEFFGEGTITAPECLDRIALSGDSGTGFDPCMALQVNITLIQGETAEVVFLLGSAENTEEAETLVTKYVDAESARKSLESVKEFWNNKLETIKVSTPDDSMNFMLNGWLQYQMISCRLWARTGHYQSGGAFGFRDQLQDCLSGAAHWPELARKQILLHARHQFIQGDVQHWWHDPQGKGVRTKISDDMLWLPYVTAEYVRISGDNGILSEITPFLEANELSETETERYGEAITSSESATLYEHCILAVDRALKFGEHGLPLMGGGDWNDGMNTVGIKGRGESVWLAWFLIAVLDMMQPVCCLQGDNETAERYADIRYNLQIATEKSGWDGDWYRRAYFDDGSPLGSASCGECRIDAIAQSWAVLSGACDQERTKKAMNMLEDCLISREDGLIKLLTPPFDSGTSEPGYIKGYVPGVRENGGQYTHAAVWAIMAFAKLGEGDKVWELFKLINPINHTRNIRECIKYKVEPYVMAADVYAVYPHIGRGGWSWYTGAAGWTYRAGIDYILGFQKNGNTVVMDPCISKEWREYTVEYKYIDTTYTVKVTNPESLSQGVKSISIDGRIEHDHVIHLVNDGKTHSVEVLMGLLNKEQ